MSLETHHFQFDRFLLDVREKVLLKDGTPIAITPKVFLLLQTLVENHGHLVEKELLLKTIWPDSFVEEGNLSFTVNLLRKALADDRQEPRFIETVRKRGYRFIADVKQDAFAGTRPNGPTAVNSHPSEGKAVRSRQRGYLLTILTILLIGTLAAGLWYARGVRHNTAEPPVLLSSFNSERLSTNGEVLHAAISPDGKKVAYTNGLGLDKQSVWLRQLDSSNSVQIIPPSDEFYFNLMFSPDGDFIYFVRGPKPIDPSVQADVFRIPAFGGVATKMISDVQGGISISPDGGRISFVRCFLRDDDYCSLWVANASDGGNERKLLSRPRPFRIGDTKIAPDGKTIAFGTGQSRTGANEFELAEVDIESGTERELTAERFFDIRRLIWLPNHRGLLITALKYPDKRFRIWQVSEPTGEVNAITKDSEDYVGLSIDRDADILAATVVIPDFHLGLYQSDNAARIRQISADAATVAFAPDGKMVFAAGRRGDLDLWSINADGNEQRQLTNTPLDDWRAVVSPDGGSVFFASNRTGDTHVWRINADGTHQTQITNVEGGVPVGVSPDGRTLFYQSALQKTLKSISTSGGQERLILQTRKECFAVSPDASLVAFPDVQGKKATLMVVSLDSGEAVHSFRTGDEKDHVIAVTWSTDGDNLYYLANNPLKGNTIWIQPLDKRTARQIARLTDEEIRNPDSFAISPDGKSFAVIQGDWKRDAVLLRGLR